MNNSLIAFCLLIIATSLAAQTYFDYQRFQNEQKREEIIKPFYDILPSMLDIFNDNKYQEYLGLEEGAAQPKKTEKPNYKTPGVPLDAEDFLGSNQ